MIVSAPAIVLAGMLAALQPPAAVQEPGQGQGVFRSTTELVTLSVTVTDGEDREVTGLGREDFVVLEEGKQQEIAFFASSDVPLDVALLIDTSSSMTEKMGPVRQAANRFIDSLRPGDRAAVVEFNTRVRILQSFTAERPLLEEAIAGTRPRGGTALYMGLYVALHHFARLQRQEGEVRKSAIVVLSDGQDTASLIGEPEIRERARRAGVPVYFISLLSEYQEEELSESGGRRRSTPEDFEMRTLARETGARAFFPSKLEELNGVYGAVARELSLQYTLAYVPSQPGSDGAFRRVLVRVPGHPGARPRTRAGYYAPTASAYWRK